MPLAFRTPLYNVTAVVSSSEIFRVRNRVIRIAHVSGLLTSYNSSLYTILKLFRVSSNFLFPFLFFCHLNSVVYSYVFLDPLHATPHHLTILLQNSRSIQSTSGLKIANTHKTKVISKFHQASLPTMQPTIWMFHRFGLNTRSSKTVSINRQPDCKNTRVYFGQEPSSDYTTQDKHV